MTDATIWVGTVPAPGVTLWLSGGDPATLSGGLSFAVPNVFPGTPVYLTATGTGDTELAFNFGPAMRGLVPAGFFPGWPGPGGIASQFNPATLKGSAALSSFTYVRFPDTPGLVQSSDAQATGAFYFEYRIAKYTLFSNLSGGGVGRLGPDLDQWTGGGGFNASDPDGGATVNGGFNNTWEVSIDALRVAGAPFASAPENTTMAVAVFLTPPPPPPSRFLASGFHPVSMVCIPCQPLCIGPGRAGWPGWIA